MTLPVSRCQPPLFLFLSPSFFPFFSSSPCSGTMRLSAVIAVTCVAAGASGASTFSPLEPLSVSTND